MVGGRNRTVAFEKLSWLQNTMWWSPTKISTQDLIQRLTQNHCTFYAFHNSNYSPNSPSDVSRRSFRSPPFHASGDLLLFPSIIIFFLLSPSICEFFLCLLLFLVWRHPIRGTNCTRVYVYGNSLISISSSQLMAQALHVWILVVLMLP